MRGVPRTLFGSNAQQLRGRPSVHINGRMNLDAVMMRGVNAAVVGVLDAALYDPVWTTTVHSPRDFGIALVGFVLLVAWRAPPLIVVAFSAAAGIAMTLV
ncbi:hypothetical protein EDE08_102267 [Bradyrhizobium sp. R2.2-H]|jgi:hypothetical protein|nr:hypothetical protein EDE10_102267 [Bradyrhizobium sp. Y-H1]TCU79802.1 hypothetical protein EDE08_102267 [Bradyrhizobium sp. R2.2-H]